MLITSTNTNAHSKAEYIEKKSNAMKQN